MSRAASGETVIVRPENNIYTVLAAVALVVVLLAMVAVWFQAESLYGGLLSPSETSVRR